MILSYKGFRQITRICSKENESVGFDKYLWNPKPEYTTSGTGRDGAQRGGGAGRCSGPHSVAVSLPKFSQRFAGRKFQEAARQAMTPGNHRHTNRVDDIAQTLVSWFQEECVHNVLPQSS